MRADAEEIILLNRCKSGIPEVGRRRRVFLKARPPAAALRLRCVLLRSSPARPPRAVGRRCVRARAVRAGRRAGCICVRHLDVLPLLPCRCCRATLPHAVRAPGERARCRPAGGPPAVERSPAGAAGRRLAPSGRSNIAAAHLLLLLPLREEAALCFPRGLRRPRGHLPPRAAVPLHAHSRVRAVPDQFVSVQPPSACGTWSASCCPAGY